VAGGRGGLGDTDSVRLMRPHTHTAQQWMVGFRINMDVAAAHGGAAGARKCVRVLYRSERTAGDVIRPAMRPTCPGPPTAWHAAWRTPPPPHPVGPRVEARAWSPKAEGAHTRHGASHSHACRMPEICPRCRRRCVRPPRSPTHAPTPIAVRSPLALRTAQDGPRRDPPPGPPGRTATPTGVRNSGHAHPLAARTAARARSVFYSVINTY
jgi:hypothetical protein